MTKIQILYDGPIVNRSDARRDGVKRYFTGKPCVNGHVDQRNASGGCCSCVKRQRENCSKCGRVRDGSHVSYCSSCYNEYKRERYLENREKEVLRVMAYNYANYEEFKERLREYRQKDSWKDVSRKWRDENTDSVRSYDRSKRAKRAKAEGSHTKDEILKLLKNQNRECAEPTCRKDLNRFGYHVDHIIPLSRGGSNSIENIQCLCPSCNCRKWAHMPEVWAAMNGRLI